MFDELWFYIPPKWRNVWFDKEKKIFIFANKLQKHVRRELANKMKFSFSLTLVFVAHARMRHTCTIGRPLKFK